MTDKSAMERMKEYAESWLDVGPEYSRGQIVDGMVNKARELLREEQAQKPPTDMAGLVEELRAWCEEVKRNDSAGPWVSDCIEHILSRYARPISGQEGKVEKEQSRERLAYCPTCSAEIKSTERRPDGDSVCVNGHKHKTKEFFRYHPSTDKCGELVKRLRAHIKTQKEDKLDVENYIDALKTKLLSEIKNGNQIIV